MTGLISYIPAVPVLIAAVMHLFLSACWQGTGLMLPGAVCVDLLSEYRESGAITSYSRESLAALYAVREPGE
jgi:hypothetical protein